MPSQAQINAPHPLAIWPWPHALEEKLYPGVTHWLDVSSTDGTTLDLLAFDFVQNPGLRLEIFDQDEDDTVPFDNKAPYWQRGVGTITHMLNQTGKGPVLAACNGLFFGYNREGVSGVAEHLSPVVLNGKS